ncbi:MAG: Gfo/Idh/MocA family oxidoreductase [Burkholderiaceae bacterium]
MRVAIVGAGYFSQFHLAGWRAIEGVELVGIADADARRAAQAATRHGIAAPFDDVARMLDSVRPDLVDLITPPPSHRALVEQTVARGIATICQKPFGTSLEQAGEIATLAQDAGVTLVVHENFRFQPWYREARRMIDAGLIGALHAVAFRLRPGDGQGQDAYLDRQPYFQTMPRLLILETGVHWIDTFRYLMTNAMGDVAAVYAHLRRLNPTIAGEDAGIVVFEFQGGATGLFDGNRLNDHVAGNPRRTMGEMWLEGSAGVLRLDGDARLWWKPHQGAEREHVYERGPAEGFGGGACEALQAHVVAHLRDGAPLENAAHDYLRNLEIQEAIYASARDGRRVALRMPAGTWADFEPRPGNGAGRGRKLP